jgi:hypothetical protein
MTRGAITDPVQANFPAGSELLIQVSQGNSAEEAGSPPITDE